MYDETSTMVNAWILYHSACPILLLVTSNSKLGTEVLLEDIVIIIMSLEVNVCEMTAFSQVNLNGLDIFLY